MNSNVSIVVAFAAGIALTWWIEGMRWDKDVSSLNESHALALKSISDKAFADLAVANQRTAEAQGAAAELDKKFTEGLAHAQAKNEALRADVAAGTRRVRIVSANLATCKLIGGSTSSPGSLGDAVQIDLTPAGESTVLSLRESTSRDAEVIQYLQGFANLALKVCHNQ